RPALFTAARYPVRAVRSRATKSSVSAPRSRLGSAPVNWEVIGACALLGGLAGVLGWAVTRGLEKQTKPRANLVRPGVGGAAIAASTQFVTPWLRARQTRAQIHDAGLGLFGSEAMANAYADAMLPILKDPRFAARLKAAGAGPKPELAVTTDNPAAASLAAS